MQRARLVVIAFLSVVALGTVALPASLAVRDAGAQQDRTITVEVKSGARGSAAEGSSCGFNAQVIVTDAAGDIVGTVDLVDASTIYLPEPRYPGTITDGSCVVSGNIDVADSGFYTFTIRDLYTWTVSADDLASDDWTMTIELPR